MNKYSFQQTLNIYVSVFIKVITYLPREKWSFAVVMVLVATEYSKPYIHEMVCAVHKERWLKLRL